MFLQLQCHWIFHPPHSNLRLYLQPITVVIPNLFGTRDQFGGRQLFHGLGVRGSFVEIQAHYIYYITFTVQFMCYYYYVSSTSTCTYQIVRYQILKVGDPCITAQRQVSVPRLAIFRLKGGRKRAHLYSFRCYFIYLLREFSNVFSCKQDIKMLICIIQIQNII